MALTKTILLLENTTSSDFPSILFVANQPETNFNADRQALTPVSQFLGSYIYQGNILALKVLWKQLYHKFLELYIDLKQNKIQKDKYQQLSDTFLKSCRIQDQIALQKGKH